MKIRILILIAGFLILGSNVLAEMYLDSNGNVGIGTTTPTAKLDVAGTIKGSVFEGDGSGVDPASGDTTTKRHRKDDGATTEDQRQTLKQQVCGQGARRDCGQET